MLQYGVSLRKRQHSNVGLVCFALHNLLNGPQRESQVAHPPALTQQTALSLIYAFIQVASSPMRYCDV